MSDVRLHDFLEKAYRGRLFDLSNVVITIRDHYYFFENFTDGRIRVVRPTAEGLRGTSRANLVYDLWIGGIHGGENASMLLPHDGKVVLECHI